MSSLRDSTCLGVFVFAYALPMLAKSVIGPGALLGPVLRTGFPRGHERDLSGFLVTRPVPLPCSETPAEPMNLTMAAFPMLPPDPNTGGRSAEERRLVRQQKSPPLSDAFQRWLRTKLGLIS
ncbi:hypothetical protein XH94_03040 [Bradyrhizobium zhanjiangense]|uniref:Uncharacterized protein n=1 Tax=Bradyrhizobium zhanjiangense TaxID=1325107 RepID=A0A4Q0SQS4_9BRAD|nr:hypothetical protein XH94_03040 [Bradyrhizobium zhanjiangense]